MAPFTGGWQPLPPALLFHLLLRLGFIVRTTLEAIIEFSRVLEGPYATPAGSGLMGKFMPLSPITGRRLEIISFDGRMEQGISPDHPSLPWEHVSVSGLHFAPSWAEMCWVKDVFWMPEEPAFQFHPPRSEYVNVHKHCLHLWALIPDKMNAQPFLTDPMGMPIPPVLFTAFPRPPKVAV